MNARKACSALVKSKRRVEAGWVNRYIIDSGINQWAARKQCVRRSLAAVICERAEQRIDISLV